MSTLFTSLDGINAPGEGSKDKSYKGQPTALQFYSHRYIDFRALNTSVPSSDVHGTSNVGSGSGSSPTKKRQGSGIENSSISAYSSLCYHAVDVDHELAERSDSALGVWNCRVGQTPESEILLQALLKKVLIRDDIVVATPDAKDGKDNKQNDQASQSQNKQNDDSSSHRIFIFTLDLSEPASVAPRLKSMQNSLVKRLENSKKIGDVHESNTTSYESLKNFEFGKAPSEGSVEKTHEGGKKIALLLACILPPAPPTNFKEKQVQALVNYHLFRFACAVKCSVGFIKPDGTSDAKAAVDIATLRDYVFRIARGLPPAVESESTVINETENKEGGEAKVESESLDVVAEEDGALLSPDSFDSTIIESAMLRNASCEGIWDANKDSLMKALPPLVQLNGSNDGNKNTLHGDDEWLKKLEKSIGDSRAKPPKSSKPKKVPKKKGAEVDATDFFSNLLGS